jgi:hypothetical protein
VSTYCLIRLIDELFGTHPLHVALGFLFGTSWTILATDQWFAADGATVSVAFSTAACLAYVKWLHNAAHDHMSNQVHRPF